MANSLRPWDSHDGYLWDIDGTLLTCTDLLHYRAFNHALSRVAGKDMTIDGVLMQGNVDVGIMRDAFHLHNVSEAVWRPHRDAIIDCMGREVERCCEQLQFSIHPAVLQILEYLQNRGAWLATATGNLRSIGTLKLRKANLLSYFDHLGWSDQFETRTEIFQSVAQQAYMCLGPDASLCVVGDTTADIRAARACNLSVLGVATGSDDFDVLRRESPDYLVSTLADLHMQAGTE